MPQKITVDELKAAVSPSVIQQLSSETQHPGIAQQIVDDTARYYGERKKWFDGSQDKKVVVQQFERILNAEILKAEPCRGRIGALAGLHKAGELETLLDDDKNVAQPSSYGAGDGDDDLTLAAKWVCSSSNTIKGSGGAPGIRAIIETELTSKRPLSIDQVDRLWRTLIPSPNPTVRQINENPAIALLCDKLGHVKLENAVTMKLGAPDSIGKALYLMATAIRAHGYPDGNGRIARVLYAISLLRGLPAAPSLPAAPAAKGGWVQEGYGRYKKVAPQATAVVKPRFRAPTAPCATALVKM